MDRHLRHPYQPHRFRLTDAREQKLPGIPFVLFIAAFFGSILFLLHYSGAFVVM